MYTFFWPADLLSQCFLWLASSWTPAGNFPSSRSLKAGAHDGFAAGPLRKPPLPSPARQPRTSAIQARQRADTPRSALLPAATEKTAKPSASSSQHMQTTVHFCSSPESSTWSSSSCWPARTAALKNGSRLRFMWLFRASTALLRPTLKNSSSLQRSSLCWSVRMRISLSESLQASLQLSSPPAPPRSQQTPSSPTGPERGMNTGNNRASSRQHDSVLSGPQRYWGL